MQSGSCPPPLLAIVPRQLWPPAPPPPPPCRRPVDRTSGAVQKEMKRPHFHSILVPPPVCPSLSIFLLALVLPFGTCPRSAHTEPRGRKKKKKKRRHIAANFWVRGPPLGVLAVNFPTSGTAVSQKRPASVPLECGRTPSDKSSSPATSLTSGTAAQTNNTQQQQKTEKRAEPDTGRCRPGPQSHHQVAAAIIVIWRCPQTPPAVELISGEITPGHCIGRSIIRSVGRMGGGRPAFRAAPRPSSFA